MTTKRQLYLKQLLSTMKYKDGWDICFIEDASSPETYDGLIRITTAPQPDKLSKRECARSRREVRVGTGDDVPEVINAVWEQILAMEIHEAQEWFEYRGKRIFYPHRFPESLKPIRHPSNSGESI